jgi:hypothetical protein
MLILHIWRGKKQVAQLQDFATYLSSNVLSKFSLSSTMNDEIIVRTTSMSNSLVNSHNHVCS